MAIVDVPSQNIELAKDLIYNTKPFSSAANLREDTCFAKSEFARYSLFSDFLTRNSSGFFECYIKEKSIKSDEDSVSTYVAVSKTVVLDVENKRLMLGMFWYRVAAITEYKKNITRNCFLFQIAGCQVWQPRYFFVGGKFLQDCLSYCEKMSSYCPAKKLICRQIVSNNR